VFGLGMGEIVVILVVALIVLGPTQLPDAAKNVGKAIRALRKHTRDLQDTIDKDEAIGGTMRELRSALRGDELFREPLLPQAPQGQTEPPMPELGPQLPAEEGVAAKAKTPDPLTPRPDEGLRVAQGQGDSTPDRPDPPPAPETPTRNG
jgi:Tat protein translocase TatB subunit